MTKNFPAVSVWLEIFLLVRSEHCVLYLQPMAFSVKSEGFSRRVSLTDLDNKEDSEPVIERDDQLMKLNKIGLTFNTCNRGVNSCFSFFYLEKR